MADDAAPERPLPPRSLIASLLLRTQPPRMRGSRLVQWCGLFGVPEGTTRVALSRMVDRGELRAQDGVYELAGRVQSRQPAQDWSLDPMLSRWRGAWRMAVVAPGARTAAERTALRDAMRRLRYAPLREGLWTRPDNLPRASAPPESWQIADDQCQWWSGQPDGDAVLLATELFEARGWSRRAERLTAAMAAVSDALGGPDAGTDRGSDVGAHDAALADGFIAGAAALAHIRADPLLPRELAADATAGVALRGAYRAYEVAFSKALRAWFLGH